MIQLRGESDTRQKKRTSSSRGFWTSGREKKQTNARVTLYKAQNCRILYTKEIERKKKDETKKTQSSHGTVFSGPPGINGLNFSARTGRTVASKK